MLKRSMFLLIISMLFLSFCSCSRIPRYKPGGPYYYKRWATNYKIPFTPVEEITAEEAKRMEVYLEAYFNKDGDIMQLTKFYKGNKQWVDKYYYKAPGKIKLREMIKENNETIIQQFDDKGKVIIK